LVDFAGRENRRLKAAGNAGRHLRAQAAREIGRHFDYFPACIELEGNIDAPLSHTAGDAA
jgi:hypothetical protein